MTVQPASLNRTSAKRMLGKCAAIIPLAMLAYMAAKTSVDALLVAAHGDLSHPEAIEQVRGHQSRGGRHR